MKEDLYINLIYQQLSGEITPAAQKELSDWQAADPENQGTYEAVVAAWHATGTSSESMEVDLEAEFSALDDRIEESETDPKAHINIRAERTESTKTTFPIWKIAAGFLLLIGIPFGLLKMGVFDSNSSQADASEMIEIKSVDDRQVARLSDGSTIFLRKGAILKYPTALGKKSRKVSLEGEAFFNIERDENRPFIVELNGSQVQVLGTSFNINSNNSETSVHVKTGKVKWKYGGNKSQLLTANMLASYSKAGDFSLRNSRNAGLWQSRVLKFDDVKLPEAIQDLEKFFEVQLLVQNPSLNNCRLSFEDKDPALENIISVLETLFNLKVIKLSENKYQLNGGACE